MAKNIQARRKLSELYKKGVEVRFGLDPETGEPVERIGPFISEETGRRIPPTEDDVVVFVRPPDPLQRDMAIREGNARRARAVVKAKRDEDSEEHLTIMAFLADMSDDTLIDYVLLGEESLRMAEAQREILALEEWKDMEAYQDAMRQFDEMDADELEGNEEWEGLLELDRKFGKQVIDRERELREAQRDVFKMILNSQGRGALEKKALEKRSELVGTQAFLDEYQIQMLWFSVRDYDNTGELFFESAKELASQPQSVLDILNEALLPFISGAEQAKNSPRAASGSEQSVPPRKPETSEASTPQEQTG